MLDRLGDLARGTLDLLLPLRCLGCGAMVQEKRRVCGGCWARLRFLAAPLCHACGLPRAHGPLHDLACESCARDPLPVERARAALAYDDGSRAMILAFKHGGRIEAADLFSHWMAERGRDVLDGAELLLPVPLHRWRLFSRGFNQAGLLAVGIARRTALAWAPDLLVRRRATRSQQGLNARSRAGNVTAEAFTVRPRHAARLAGRRVVLIDDVLTTGATLGACAAVLRHHGAASVDALTLARVVRGQGIPI